MDNIISFLNNNVVEIIKNLVIILTAVWTVVQQFKKADK